MNKKPKSNHHDDLNAAIAADGRRSSGFVLNHAARAPGKLGLSVMAGALLAGCAGVPQVFKLPDMKLPSQYSQQGADAASASSAGVGAVSQANTAPNTNAWWQAFNDSTLNALVDEVLARNNNLAAAALRVRRAQLQAGLASEQQGVQFTASANVGSTRALESGAATVGSSGVRLGASYELDLWKRVAAQEDAARWEALASAQDLQSTRLALVGTTARLYWQHAFVQQRLAANADSIAYAQNTLRLIEVQYRAGAASGLELAEARQALASQQASQPALQQQLTQTRTALALLLNAAPGSLELASATPSPAPAQTSAETPAKTSAQVPAQVPGQVPAQAPAQALKPSPQASAPSSPAWLLPKALLNTPLPEVQPGLPASLLGQRPDLRAAELRLRQALANTDAARASAYPAFSLTGSLGSSSTALASALQNPVAALGLGVTLPFLQRSSVKLNIGVSEAQYEEAALLFRQTLYTALGEVDDALGNRTQLAVQAERLQEALQAAQTAERLYEVRYRAGAVALKAWLDAQEKRRNAEIALADNRLARLNNQVALFQALGGAGS